MMIIGHWQKKDTTATILDIIMYTSQQQVGISTPIFETAFDKYGFLLENSWIKQVWIFLTEMQGKLVFSNIWTPQSDRQNDVTIIEKIMEMNIPTTTQKQLNLCRLHKEYYYVTDLFDSQNKYLHQDVFSPEHKRTNNQKFPTVQVPAQYWRVWETAIQTIYRSIRISRHMIGTMMNKKDASALCTFIA